MKKIMILLSSALILSAGVVDISKKKEDSTSSLAKEVRDLSKNLTNKELAGVIAIEIDKTAPYKIDSITTLNKGVVSIDNEIVLTHTIDSVGTKKLLSNVLKKEINTIPQKFFNNLSGTLFNSTRSSICMNDFSREVLKHNITYRYKYLLDNKKLVSEFTIENNDCIPYD